jgi:UDPglucose--hexose-1-phosphate uridylyltransferase
LSGPQVRIDQLTGLRVILAPGRSARPDDFSAEVSDSGDGERDCPFDEGRESETPPELWADRPKGKANGPGWLVRAIPNLFPVLGDGQSGTELQPHSERRGAEDLFLSTPANGAHEVVVSCPDHRTALAELDEAAFARALAGWRERMRAHGESALVHLIVNEGAAAGASREHSHAQLFALDFVPSAVARERERVASYAERTQGGTLLEDIAAEEVRLRERLVAVDDEALLVCPWASRGPFELRVIPRRPAPRFEEDEGGAAMIHTALRTLAKRFGRSPELNLWIRTAPRGVEQFCWHLDIAPRQAIKAGFEMGTGVEINSLAPEQAASELRESLA